MGLTHWLRTHLLGDGAHGNDAPAGVPLVHTGRKRTDPTPHALGEYHGADLPTELAELLQRRAEVAVEVLRLDITDQQGRTDAIPRLRELLRRYPHPLVYEMLIHAYLGTGRFDEAKGVAFAARERRAECTRSPHPEIRAEVESLHEWNPGEIDELRAESEARNSS